MPLGSKKQKREDRRRAKKLSRAAEASVVPDVCVISMERLLRPNKKTAREEDCTTLATAESKPSGHTVYQRKCICDMDDLNHDVLRHIADTPMLRQSAPSVLALFSSTRHTSTITQAPLDLGTSARCLDAQDIDALQKRDSRFLLRGARLDVLLTDEHLSKMVLTTLRHLNLRGCAEISDISPLWHCKSLAKLDISQCSKILEIPPLGKALTELCAVGCSALERASGLGECKALSRAEFRRCSRLRDIAGLSQCQQLTTLDLGECSSLENTFGASLACCTSLTELRLNKLSQSLDLTSLGQSHSLRVVDVSECRRLAGLSGLTRCRSLSTLDISRCPGVHHLDGFRESQSLRELAARDCQNLRDISDLQHCQALESLDIKGCSLVVEAHVDALRSCPSLQILHIRGTKVKNLSRLRQTHPTLVVVR